MTFFPTIVEGPGSDGGYCAVVVGTPVLGQGDTVVDALRNAAIILQEVIDDLARDGEPPLEPGNPDDDDAQGVLAMIPAFIPAHAA